MRILLTLLTLGFAASSLTPAHAGGINPMILFNMVRQMPRMMPHQSGGPTMYGHPQMYGRPEIREYRRPMLIERPRVVEQPRIIERHLIERPAYGYSMGAQGYGGGSAGYVEGGTYEHHEHREVRHEEYQHFGSRVIHGQSYSRRAYAPPVERSGTNACTCNCCNPCGGQVVTRSPEWQDIPGDTSTSQELSSDVDPSQRNVGYVPPGINVVRQ